MVVVILIAVLTSLAFLALRRIGENAKSATNLGNLRNLASLVTIVTDQGGAFPPGWSFSKGESWADLVVRDMHEGSAHQDPILLSPHVAKEIPPDLRQTAISNYAANPFIFVQEGYAGERGYKVTTTQLQRPSRQILLGDALPRSDSAPYGFSMIVWWGLRQGTGNSGSPPVSNEALSERTISLPHNIVDLTNDGGKGYPAFRNQRKGHFLFADGHVEALQPKDLKYKHFAISY